ncbi:MAG TPA: uroporphyrinogen-III C-methyltransferase [Mycobacteriales bacterium]|nr:uroporphyrinogen-III C-methyltransferase [Mycobacteriales bacterium]
MTDPAGGPAAGYPVVLDLAGRRVVVVGGGAVALRRTRGLLAAGASVHVVAPEVHPELAGLPVRVHRRRYAPGDLAGAWLAHACTDSAEVNAAVAADAGADRIVCVRADDASGGTARTPAVARSGAVTVAVDSAGDPRRSVAVRDAVAALLDRGLLSSRPHRAPAGGPGPPGRVWLVGGGPGDPELITVRGRRLLAEADVVVVDRLAPRALLDTLGPGVEVVDAGKAPHRSNLTQEQINAVLVDRARRGLRVVRLKGGDPFVFGRGGEELAACVAAGVPAEVVPGVSSAMAGPAAAGIPVTHRGVAADFAVVSGHLDPSRPGSTVDWQSLATGPATLVLLMALERLDAVCAELIKRGRPGTTPTAVVCRATWSDQRVVLGTLATIAERAAAAGLRPPAVVVIGEVVRLAGPAFGPDSVAGPVGER